MKAKKSLALILALLMLGSQFAACSDSTENADTTGETTADPNAAEATDTLAEETADPNARVDDGLEDGVTYDGYTFNIFQHTAVYKDFQAEEITGEPINDADFERRTAVEDKLDVVIKFHDLTAGQRDGQVPLGTVVQAGTNDYDIGSIMSYSACNALTQGLLTNLFSVPNLDLEREWWDQYCTEECTFVDKVYFMTGDISIGDNRNTFCAYFNKNMAEEYQLPNFYEMVDNGTWTIENFQKQAEAVTANLDFDNDGNHVNDADDIYGIWIWDDVMMGIVNAADIKCCTVNKQTGDIELTLMSEKFLDTFEKFAAYAFNKDVTCAYQRNGYAADYGSIAFREGRGLFFLQNVGSSLNFREMEDEFGILPLPKYDEQQDRYISSGASWGLPFYVIPRLTYDQEGYARIGYITQALAYESMYTMTPAFYDQTLQNKISRDEESARMLDIIFESRSYDFGWYFEFGNYNETIMIMLRTYDTNFSSKYKTSSKVAEKKIKKANEAIKAMELNNEEAAAE